MASTDDSPQDAFSAFVAQARQGRNSLPRIFIGTVIILAVWFAGTVLLMSLGAFAEATDWLPPGWGSAAEGKPFTDFAQSRLGFAAMLLTLGFIWPGVWIVIRLLHKRKLRTLLGATGRLAWGSFGRAFVATVVVAGLVSLVTLFTEAKIERTDISLVRWLIALPFLAILLLIQTSAEELLFRGYLLQTLAARFRAVFVWAILPAAVFAAMHWAPGAQPWMNGMAVFSIFVFAMSAVVLVRLTGNLGAAMGMHFGNNLVALLFVSSGSASQSFAFYVTPSIEDAGWTVADAVTGGILQMALTGGILALLLWRRSPLAVAPGGTASQSASW